MSARAPLPFPGQPAPIILCGQHRTALVCLRCSVPEEPAVPTEPPARMFLTVQEACHELNVSRPTFDMLVREHGLPLRYLGERERLPRVVTSELVEWARQWGKR